MREYTEYTAKNFLRSPLVFGVPLFGLISLSFMVLFLLVVGGNGRASNLISLALASCGYLALRVLSRFAKPGWEESLVWLVEKKVATQLDQAEWRKSTIELSSPELLDADEQIYHKEKLTDRIERLKTDENLCFRFSVSELGVEAFEGERCLPPPSNPAHVYSLYSLPITTNPLSSLSFIKSLPFGSEVYIRVSGLDPREIKQRLERSRRRNVQENSKLTDIDSEVTFQEASKILEKLSRGDEKLIQFSLVIGSPEKIQSLDQSTFVKEKNGRLALSSITALRERFHRSFTLRVVSAADLIPSLCEPREAGKPIFKNSLGVSVYFSPLDARLEALHWLVVGASGSGKSFLTGLILKRLIEQGERISVLFLDHGRSFRRVVIAQGGEYLEPESLLDLETSMTRVVSPFLRHGQVAGIELSDLSAREKKEAAQLVLERIDSYLCTRQSVHPVYLVLDECWNFLRDEPVLVQRAFREFRKLNAGVIAITQSLSDFVTDQTGQSIFQNAPVRILLRQGEDLTSFRGALGLNQTELKRVRRLKQVKEEYSECLIKTPFLSRLGRLYPTPEEYELLRTDNLREELIQKFRSRSQEAMPCAAYLL